MPKYIVRYNRVGKPANETVIEAKDSVAAYKMFAKPGIEGIGIVDIRAFNKK